MGRSRGGCRGAGEKEKTSSLEDCKALREGLGLVAHHPGLFARSVMLEQLL